MPRNAFYAQSGGVTAVINATAAGVIETARAHPDRIGKVLAGRNGIIGALTEDLIDTSLESAASIAALKHTPSGAFGSCRYKLKGLDENRAEYERLIDVFRAHDIGYFFYNGGGDSSDTAFKVSQLGEALDYPIIAVGIPKTVDNDLPITDNCPGFGSVREVRRGVHSRGVVRCRVDGAHVDEGLRSRGDGPSCRLDRGGGRSGRGSRGRSAADHPVPGDRVRRGCVHREGAGVGGEGRLLLGRRLRGGPQPRRALPLRGRHERRVRPRAARRGGAGHREPRQGEARIQVPLGGGGLSSARGAAHRVADRPRPGLGARPRRRSRSRWRARTA